MFGFCFVDVDVVVVVDDVVVDDAAKLEEENFCLESNWKNCCPDFNEDFESLLIEYIF